MVERRPGGWSIHFEGRKQIGDFLLHLESQIGRIDLDVSARPAVLRSVAALLTNGDHLSNGLAVRFTDDAVTGVILGQHVQGLRFASDEVLRQTFLQLLPEGSVSVNQPRFALDIFYRLGLLDVGERRDDLAELEKVLEKMRPQREGMVDIALSYIAHARVEHNFNIKAEHGS